MPIKKRRLEPGTVLVGNYKKDRHECRVDLQAGKQVFVLTDGRPFKSPSAAAGAIMGRKAVNGWLFWSLSDADVSRPLLPAQLRQTPHGKPLRRLPNQRGIEAGKARYWCNACMKSFVGDAMELPDRCPAGHTTDASSE